MTYIEALLKIGKVDTGRFAGFLSAWLKCPGEVKEIEDKLKEVLPKSSEELFNKYFQERGK